MTTQGWDPRNEMAEVLYDEEAIQQRVRELAEQITRDYLPRWQENPRWSLAIISVLRGAVFFVTDLVRYLQIPVTVDFMAIASYGTRGRVQIIKDLEDDIEDRDLLVVEDIVDTGLTLGYLLTQLKARAPRSLVVASLIDRKGFRLMHDLPLRYTGFEVGDRFVVGYGLDFQERYRNLRYLGVLKEEAMADEPSRLRFAHPSEADFAKLLDFYRIRWVYEPRTFVLREDEEGKTQAGFSPDFYLPEYDLYIEVTTRKPHLMNRKLRQVEAMHRQYPDVRIDLVDRADFAMLAKKLKARELS